MNKTVDIIFSVILVYIAPALAGFGLVRFRSGDFLGKLASIGLLVVAVFIFGIACMGLGRMSLYFQKKGNKVNG